MEIAIAIVVAALLLALWLGSRRSKGSTDGRQATVTGVSSTSNGSPVNIHEQPTLPPGAGRPDPSQQSEFSLEAAAATDVGGRPNNEDTFLISGDLFLVADGMGGKLGGEHASRLLKEAFEAQANGKEAEWFDKSVNAAHRAMRLAVANNGRLDGMGTTVTAARSFGNRMEVFWAGDTDFFRLSGGKFERLTFEHSLARFLLSQGAIKPHELKRHPFRNTLHKYVGAVESPDWDEVPPFSMQEGDVYLISSDGLRSYCQEAQIAEILARNLSAQDKADALVELALAQKTRDNVTALVIHVRKKLAQN